MDIDVTNLVKWLFEYEASSFKYCATRNVKNQMKKRRMQKRRKEGENHKDNFISSFIFPFQFLFNVCFHFLFQLHISTWAFALNCFYFTFQFAFHNINVSFQRGKNWIIVNLDIRIDKKNEKVNQIIHSDKLSAQKMR